jgi:hypothetical protein
MLGESIDGNKSEQLGRETGQGLRVPITDADEPSSVDPLAQAAALGGTFWRGRLPWELLSS